MADSPPDPTFRSLREKDAKRCVFLAKRIGYEATIVDLKIPGVNHDDVFGLNIKLKHPKKDKTSILLSSVNMWRVWLDQQIWHAEPFSLMYWNSFPPSEAKFIEKEIHKWIKEYKEVD